MATQPMQPYVDRVILVISDLGPAEVEQRTYISRGGETPEFVSGKTGSKSKILGQAAVRTGAEITYVTRGSETTEKLRRTYGFGENFQVVAEEISIDLSGIDGTA